MPADLNRVTLVGRLTRDPELRHTAGGQSVCSLRLAVSSRGRDEGGNWSDRANYFDVTVFGRTAETASNYLSKGRRIGVDGRLSWREWEAQDGAKRQAVDIIADSVQFLGSREDAVSGGGFAPGNAGPGGEVPVEQGDFQPAPVASASGDDDIPF